MFDWIRERLKDADTKREERVTAYVDGRLSAEQRRQFEAQLAQDETLRAEVTALQAVKQQLTALPTVRAPRNYTLDPALYGAPDSAFGAQIYPAVRFATAMAALVFIFMVTLTLLPDNQAAQETAMSEPVAVEIVREAPQDAAAYEAEPASDDAEFDSSMSGEAEEAVMAESIETDAASDMAAESVMMDEAGEVAEDSNATNIATNDNASSRTLMPTIAAFEEAAPVPPEIMLPTEEVRLSSTVTASAGTMANTQTEQIEEGEIGETVVSADNATQSWLILSATLFVVLLVLLIWLRRTAL